MTLIEVAVPIANPDSAAQVGAGAQGIGWAPLPPSGRGYLAGEAPAGLTRLEGVPTSADIRIVYRPASGAVGDGIVVQRLTSAPDGSWVAWGLNPALKYDVIGRKAGQNDVIMANVSPSPYDQITIEGDFTVDDDNRSLIGDVLAHGGIPPYTVGVSDGAAPPGVAFAMVGHKVEAVHPASGGGDFTWELEVTSSNGATQRKTFTATTIAATFAETVLALEPWGYWKLDGTGSAMVADSSGNGRNGTASGALTGAQAPVFAGGVASVLFSGGNINLPTFTTAARGSNKLTLLCSFITTATGIRQLISADGGTRQLQFRLNNGAVEVITFHPTFAGALILPATLNDGSPHQVALVLDDSLSAADGTVKVYADGVLLGQSTTTTEGLVPSTNVFASIGSRASSLNSEPFSGRLDECAIIKSALSPVDIANLWSARESA